MKIALEAALERWVEAGLLAPNETARILEFEKAQAPRPRSRLPMVLGLTFGAMMLAAGILLFVSAHWVNLSPAQRIALLVFAVGGLHAGAAFCSERFPATATALHAAGTAALGGAIFLSAQIFNLEEHWPTGLLLWAMGSLAGLLLLRDWPQLAFAAVLIPLWLICEWTDAASNLADASQVVAVGAALLAISYFSVPSPQVFTWIGGIALLPAILAVAAGRWYGIVTLPASTAVATLGWTAALLLPLAFAYFYRRKRAWINGIAALWAMGLSWISEQRLDIAAYAWCAIGCAGLIAWGIFEFRAERVNLGMAFFALTIICFFFSSVMDKLGRSASLTVLGIVFLGGGWYWEKLRRRLVRQIRTGGVQ